MCGDTTAQVNKNGMLWHFIPIHITRWESSPCCSEESCCTHQPLQHAPLIPCSSCKPHLPQPPIHAMKLVDEPEGAWGHVRWVFELKARCQVAHVTALCKREASCPCTIPSQAHYKAALTSLGLKRQMHKCKIKQESGLQGLPYVPSWACKRHHQNTFGLRVLACRRIYKQPPTIFQWPCKISLSHIHMCTNIHTLLDSNNSWVDLQFPKQVAIVTLQNIFSKHCCTVNVYIQCNPAKLS